MSMWPYQRKAGRNSPVCKLRLEARVQTANRQRSLKEKSMTVSNSSKVGRSGEVEYRKGSVSC